MDTTVVATRQLRDKDDPETLLNVTLFSPTQTGTHNQWSCKYTITGLEEQRVFQAVGVDALQSLFLALEHLRKTLAATGKRLTYIGSDEDPGFFRIVLDPFGSGFMEHMNEIVDREMTRVAQDLIDRGKAKLEEQSKRQ